MTPESTPIEEAVADNAPPFGNVSGDIKIAAVVAGFGMFLRDSRHKGEMSLHGIEKSPRREDYCST